MKLALLTFLALFLGTVMLNAQTPGGVRSDEPDPTIPVVHPSESLDHLEDVEQPPATPRLPTSDNRMRRTANVPDGSSHRVGATLVAAAGITALLMTSDQKAYEALHDWKNRNSPIRSVSPVVTEMGNGGFSLALFGSMIGYSVFTGDRRSMEAGKVGMESFILSGIIVQLLKHSFGRERPSDATSPGGTFHGPFSYFQQGRDGRGLAAFDAFPSGHTASAVAAATALSDIYADKPWVGITSYSLAAVVAVTRVTERTHWLSDCFVGALIGHYSTKLIESLNYGTTSPVILPFIAQQNSGVTFQLQIP